MTGNSSRFKSRAYLFLALLLLFSLSPRLLAEKDYLISRVDIQAQLRDDGSLEVIESRTYDFKGSFSYVFRVLPTSGPVVFTDFWVGEGSQRYERAETRVPGTYTISERTGEIEVRWYFRARDEALTFQFHYVAQGAIRRYEDAAVLYFQFISRDWDRESRNVTLKLRPPVAISAASLNEWLHGPLWAESRIEPDGTITAWCDYLPARTYLETRALYPPEIFLAVRPESGQVRSKIMDEEAAWAEEANRQRRESARRESSIQKRWGWGKWVMILISLAGLFGWGKLYNQFGKRPQLPYRMEMTSEIPAKTPPALLSYLLNNQYVYGSALVSTIFDLARRSYLKVRQEEKEERRLFGGMKTRTRFFLELDRASLKEKASALLPYEEALLRFIFDDLAAGQDSIDLRTIAKQRTRFQKFFERWKKGIKKLGQKQEWFDRLSRKGLRNSLFIGSFMLALGFASIFFFGPWALILIASAVIVLILSFLIPHRTLQGEMLAQQWKSVKKYLINFHFRGAETDPLLAKIDDYFVYAAALGVGAKVLKELALRIPSDRYDYYLPWFAFHGTGGRGFSADAFAQAFSSMAATASSAMSTASGTGGGASVGGGGGASSGGGGAG